MPNWSYCSFEIICSPGEEKDVQRFFHSDPWFDDRRDSVQIVRALTANEGNGTTPLSFERLLPTPEGVDWYDWRVTNWGTKWDAHDASLVSSGNGSVRYLFATAWAPPREWLEKVVQSKPEWDFTLAFVDEGPFFAGVFEVVDGKVVKTMFHGDEAVRLADYGLGGYWHSDDDDDWLQEYGANDAAFALDA